MNDNKIQSSGTSITTVLTLIFVVLKLTGVINWSWWWVLSPTLIGTAIALIFFIVITVLTYQLKQKAKTKKKKKS